MSSPPQLLGFFLSLLHINIFRIQWTHLHCYDGPPTKLSKKMHHLYKVGKPRRIWLLADAAGSRQKITMWERHSRLKLGTPGSQVVIVGCTVANWKGVLSMSCKRCNIHGGEALRASRKAVILQEPDRMDTRFFSMVLCWLGLWCPLVWFAMLQKQVEIEFVSCTSVKFSPCHLFFLGRSCETDLDGTSVRILQNSTCCSLLGWLISMLHASSHK